MQNPGSYNNCRGFKEDRNHFKLCLLELLTHGNDYIVCFLALFVRNNVSVYCLAVHGHGYDTLFHVLRVFHLNVIDALTELTGDGEITEALGNTRIYGQALMSGIYTQYILGDIYESPCSSTGQPAVLCLAVEFCILTGYHLGIYIRLGTMDLTDILNVCGTGLAVDLESSVTSAQNGLCDGYPGIVVAEDTGILLISGGIRGYFTKFEVILRVCRL